MAEPLLKRWLRAVHCVSWTVITCCTGPLRKLVVFTLVKRMVLIIQKMKEVLLHVVLNIWLRGWCDRFITSVTMLSQCMYIVLHVVLSNA